ncbi:patatin-like phospholipase family protein [Parachlamydia sp. AcF125]|uniref:patatin-like phospholipase family protein n=1 Tax=Parachlamydia sp. AcF125 TaxID=2795736 RepID=UPI002015E85C|nr:patatin-like phospholipase family protein [Parachlamydia sp. AcF125]
MEEAEQSVIMHFLRTRNDEIIKKIAAKKLYETLVGRDSNRAIHEVVRGGHHKLVPILFGDTELAQVNALDSRGANLLISAIEGRQKAFVNVCLQYGNLPNHYFIHDKFRLNAFSFAVYKGAIECLDQLVETLQKMQRLNKINFLQETNPVGNLLHLTIWANQPEMLQHLLTKYRKKTLPLVENEDRDGRTPLMLAASLGDIQSSKILLDAGALLEARDSKGRTAMHYAAEKNNRDVIRFLSKKGADESAQDCYNNAPSQCGDEVTAQLLLNIKSKKQVDDEFPTDYIALPPHNCIFQGGGAKGLVYLGVIKALEKLNFFDDLKRFAGTSAGALSALFLSLGMRTTEVENTLKDTSLAKLLDLLTFRVSTEEEKQSIIQYLGIVKKAGSTIGKLGIACLKSLAILVGRRTGWTDGEELKNWLNLLIEKYTYIPNCTFGELSDLIKGGGYNPKGRPFKHLHVITTDLKTSSLLHINSEHKKWKNFLIADAVVASAAYPVLIALQTMREKIDGILIPNHNYQCSDGGILLNLPAEIFDRVEQPGWMDPQLAIPQFNRRSIAFCFEQPKITPSEDKESVYAFLGSVLTKIYMNSENLTRQMLSKKHEERLVRISTGGITTTEFRIKPDDEKGIEAIDNAYITTKKFFEERRRNEKSFFK